MINKNAGDAGATSPLPHLNGPGRQSDATTALYLAAIYVKTPGRLPKNDAERQIQMAETVEFCEGWSLGGRRLVRRPEGRPRGIPADDGGGIGP